MKRTSWIAVVALGALVLACEKPDADDDMDDAPTAAEIAAVRSVIEAANVSANAALNSGDVAKFEANYAEDAILMMPNTPAWRGRAAIAAGIKGMLESADLSDTKFTTEDVLLGGDIAVETGSLVMTIAPTGGKPMVDHGKYVTTWKRQADGGWKIVRDISNSDLPAPM